MFSLLLIQRKGASASHFYFIGQGKKNCQSLYYSKAEEPNNFPVFHILYNFLFFLLFFLYRGWDIGCLLIVESESRRVQSLQWGAGKGDSEEVGTRFFSLVPLVKGSGFYPLGI